MKVDELLNILHFQHDVALKCTYKFSTFKYYNRIHQTSNWKVCLNSIWLIIFKNTCYLFYCTNFFQIYNHFIMNLKKSTMFLLCYLKLFSIYFLLLVSKIGLFFYFFKKTIFYVYFTMLSSNGDWWSSCKQQWVISDLGFCGQLNWWIEVCEALKSLEKKTLCVTHKFPSLFFERMGHSHLSMVPCIH